MRIGVFSDFVAVVLFLLDFELFLIIFELG